jgi:hypothetical protein
VTAHGRLREWSHGALHAFLEPTETGYRLRLTDSRAGALGVGLLMGGTFVAFGFIAFVALVSKGNPGLRMLIPLLFGLGGGGAMALSALSLPGWARAQERKLEHISAFARTLLAVPPPGDE